jgi:hypothetical protein
MRHPLSGADLFHLLVHRSMVARGLPGNISRILFHLADAADGDTLRTWLVGNRLLHQVRAIRARFHWPQKPCFEPFHPVDPGFSITHTEDPDVWLGPMLQKGFGPEDGRVRIDVALSPHGTYALLSMDHVLFDHRGMINLLHALEAGQWQGPWYDDAPEPAWGQRLRHASAAMLHAFGSAGPRMATLASGKPRAATYTHTLHTTAHTTYLRQQATRAGAGSSLALYTMALTAQRVATQLDQRGTPWPYLWFSTPHDLRPRGASGHLIGNRMSFFFFRLSAQVARHPDRSVPELMRQLRHQVRHQGPQRYFVLLGMFRHLPLWLSTAMFNLPSAGRWATFAFSDLGDLDRLPATCMGRPVLAATHYPPVPSPPGMSVAAGLSHACLLVVEGRG